MAKKRKEKASDIPKVKKKGYVYIKSQEKDSLFLRRGQVGDMLSKLNPRGIKNKKKKAELQAKYDEALAEYNRCTELAGVFSDGKGLSDKADVEYIVFCLGLHKSSLEMASPCDAVERNLGEVKSLIKSYNDILEDI